MNWNNFKAAILILIFCIPFLYVAVHILDEDLRRQYFKKEYEEKNRQLESEIHIKQWLIDNLPDLLVIIGLFLFPIITYVFVSKIISYYIIALIITMIGIIKMLDRYYTTGGGER